MVRFFASTGIHLGEAAPQGTSLRSDGHRGVDITRDDGPPDRPFLPGVTLRDYHRR